MQWINVKNLSSAGNSKVFDSVDDMKQWVQSNHVNNVQWGPRSAGPPIQLLFVRGTVGPRDAGTSIAQKVQELAMKLKSLANIVSNPDVYDVFIDAADQFINWLDTLDHVIEAFNDFMNEESTSIFRDGYLQTFYQSLSTLVTTQPIDPEVIKVSAELSQEVVANVNAAKELYGEVVESLKKFNFKELLVQLIRELTTTAQELPSAWWFDKSINMPLKIQCDLRNYATVNYVIDRIRQHFENDRDTMRNKVIELEEVYDKNGNEVNFPNVQQDYTLATTDTSQTLSNKTLVEPVMSDIIVNSHRINLWDLLLKIVTLNDEQTLKNKTLINPLIYDVVKSRYTKTVDNQTQIVQVTNTFPLKDGRLALDDDVLTNARKIADVAKDVSGVINDVAGIADHVVSLADSIDSIASRVGSIGGSMLTAAVVSGMISSALWGYATKDWVEDYTYDKDTIKDKLGDRALWSALDDKVTYNALNDRLNGYVTNSTLATLTSQLQTLQSTLNDINDHCVRMILPSPQ